MSLLLSLYSDGLMSQQNEVPEIVLEAASGWLIKPTRVHYIVSYCTFAVVHYMYPSILACLWRLVHSTVVVRRHRAVLVTAGGRQLHHLRPLDEMKLR